MRIQQLNLLRYGKFTDQGLNFPGATSDFHLIVGANEAGKSTTRSAILDLLYGIEPRSTFDFLHAKNEMRLAATLEHQGRTLAMVRIKGRSKSLLGPAGIALAEGVLAPFLGETDRAFFDKMFGLDHGRLEAGGNAILNASDDVGQILFQSAAGIASLGTVRDQLEAEAETLWSRRKAAGRAYYVGSDELARAEAALKAATVRTRDWMEARDKVLGLEEQRDGCRARYRELDVQRIRLERVRRVGAAVTKLRSLQEELLSLADVALLPPEAAKQLADNELELARAESERDLCAGQARQASQLLAVIQVDEQLLKHETGIGSLAERGQQLRNHGRDIERRQAEIAVHWRQVEDYVRQLGWPSAGEETLTHKLPTLPARSAVTRLAKSFGVLAQSRKAAADDVSEKEERLESLQSQLQGLAVVTVPPALRVALTEARALGDITAVTRRDELLVAKSNRELASAVAALAPWAPDLATLRGLTVPSVEDIRARIRFHGETQAARRTLVDQGTVLSREIRVQELEITQYRNAHHPVSIAELTGARGERDQLWHTIKSGDKAVHEVAEAFEAKVVHADGVSDRRHDKAQEASELQAKLDSLERLRQRAADNASAQADNERECAVMEEDWTQVTTSRGLSGLPLQDFEQWRAARDKALRAEEALNDASEVLHHGQQTARAAAGALAAALRGAGILFDAAATLSALVVIASDAVESATETRARLDELTKQRATAVNALAKQREKAKTTQDEFDAWTVDWQAATAAAALPEAQDVESAESALAVMANIDEAMRVIRDLRLNRIATMQRDLKDFAAEATAVMSEVAPDLSVEEPGSAIGELLQRLTLALDNRKEADRLRKEIKAHETQAKAAKDRGDGARAAMAPLLHLAQVTDYDELRALITRSDERRRLQAAASAAEKTVEDGGDGVAMEALEAEIVGADASQIPAQISDIGREIETVRLQQETLTADLAHANARLAGIAGQADGARAEAERQDALAKMANAAERYIKVYTASRLLRWAIDRYRETKQGPMLSCAGEIFRALTLDSFQGLRVDFDSDPLTLHGVRSGGGLVGLAGMSNGTRDQLYLALRLAAMELHLQDGHALPFIADDLFINYDDKRAKAGLEALAHLSKKTQVLFLSHHDHLVPTVKAVFGQDVNVVYI